MNEKNRKKVDGELILRTVILFLGLIMATFYGIKGEWDAALIGLSAAGIAFCIKRKKRE